MAIGLSTGTPFKIREVSPLYGGSIHRAWRVNDARRNDYVMPGTTTAVPIFAAEVRGLKSRSAIAVALTPTLMTFGQTGIMAFLISEHLVLMALDQCGGTRLGAAPAQLDHIWGDSLG